MSAVRALVIGPRTWREGETAWDGWEHRQRRAGRLLPGLSAHRTYCEALGCWLHTAEDI
jgi:hypothetical protein